MKIGFVYAGQGSQVVGMGRDLYDAYPAARRIFDDIRLDFDVKQLCFDGPPELLNQTPYTQPCMVAMAVVLTDLLAGRGIVPAMAAGLSLGEYSALYAAGVFDARTVLELVRFRGRAMEEAARGIDSKMAAVLGIDRQELLDACREAGSLGVVEIANYNCPGQLVIGGERAAVDKAAEGALHRHAKRVIPLNVSGPFHTSLMEPAARRMAEKFKTLAFNEPTVPVVFNATARTLQRGQTIPELLTRQVMSSVYFEDSVRAMENAGVDTFIEIGPGKVLSGFIRKINRDLAVYTVEDGESLEAVAAALKEGKSQ